MGMGHLRFIMQELMAGGMPPQTPAGVVQWASLGRQRSVVGTVATLPDVVEKAKLGAPAIIFVGEVVRSHEQIDWFEHLPLFGKRVAITRTREQGSELRDKLEVLGAEVLELPLIRVTKEVDKQNMADVFLEMGGYDWIVFTSPNGVKYFFEEFFRVYDEIRNLGLLRIACVGEATARAIRDMHLKVECMPETATAEALADQLIATGSLDSAKVLVITGNLNRDTLVQKLEEAQAIVDRFQVYKTEKTDLSGDAAAEEFRQRGADAILFCSSSAAEGFSDQGKSLQLAEGAKRPLAGSIGPQTSETMKKVGVPVAFEAKKPSLDALVEALVTKLSKTKSAE
jgi:uroporphyrinogen III methyltransferase/synthase